MPSTILLVDDEKDILDLLKYNLEKEGYKVSTASNGKQALKLVQQKPEIVVLDVMMPEMDGWEVCRAIRSNPETADIPVVFLTAKEGEIDEIVGLELGAADYITKPVRIRTFIARIKRLLRTQKEGIETKSRSVVKIEDLEIHPDNYMITLGGKNISLPKKEFEILLFLVRHPDRVVTRETLLNSIWGEDVYVVDRTIDVHIRKIREKLNHFAKRIETVKGVGYRFRKEH
jgi:two-component system alkaline phosphatase synthesis response regulator PhoP